MDCYMICFDRERERGKEEEREERWKNSPELAMSLNQLVPFHDTSQNANLVEAGPKGVQPLLLQIP